jgi:hypothetical protein
VLLLWVLGAGLSLYSLRSRSTLYGLFLVGGILALYAAAFGVIVRVALSFSADFDTPRWLMAQFIAGFVLGLATLTIIGRYRTIPGWVTYLLPVRGNHARRFLATVAVGGLVAPLAGTLSLAFAAEIVPVVPPAGVWVLLLGITAYFAPLWDSLARWMPSDEVGDVSPQAVSVARVSQEP